MRKKRDQIENQPNIPATTTINIDISFKIQYPI